MQPPESEQLSIQPVQLKKLRINAENISFEQRLCIRWWWGEGLIKLYLLIWPFLELVEWGGAAGGVRSLSFDLLQLASLSQHISSRRWPIKLPWPQSFSCATVSVCACLCGNYSIQSRTRIILPCCISTCQPAG